jgi:hypothetical protein
MYDAAALRRAAEFLQDLEKNLASPLTNTVPIPASVSALKNPQSTNPQETPSAPPVATPHPTNLGDLARRA